MAKQKGRSVKSIAGYLMCSRKHVYMTLKRRINEQFAGLADKSSRPHQPATKTTLRAMQEVKRLQINPELGEYRVSAALEQIGIKLSPRPYGRILALNRELYHLQKKTSEEGRADRAAAAGSVRVKWLRFRPLWNQ